MSGHGRKAMPNPVNREFVFDLASYARRGPGHRDRLTPAEVQHIRRTVDRVPEVMVKVLSRGATTVSAARRHVDYIDRKGEVPLETDEGVVRGRDAGLNAIEDWDLNVDQYRSTARLQARTTATPPRLVHKLMFSMPPGTPPQKVLVAVQRFCREEFALQHRYLMALHTDEPHPHVHVVVKAMSERGERLNIRNDTLRRWRAAFAQQLRDAGVPANATSRFARGITKPQKLDGIYRAAARGNSTHLRVRTEAVARDLDRSDLRDEEAKRNLMASRTLLQRLWDDVATTFKQDGRPDISTRITAFVRQMPPPDTEQAIIARELIRSRALEARDGPAR